MNIAENDDYIMPGEFEPQSAVWLGWPTFQWFSDPALDTRPTIATLAKVLSEHDIASNIMCGDAEGISKAQDWLKENGFPISSSMHFLAIDQVDIWVRDYGPIFLVDRTSGKLAIASYKQNQWGYSTETNPISERMSQLPKAVLEHLNLDTLLATDVISEGGDRIQNGQGTLLVDRAVELQRNPGTSVQELDEAYKYTLGVSKIIWLNAGVREDLHSDWGPIPYRESSGEQILLYGPQSTGGHLDELCRFVSPNRILLAQVTEEDAATDAIASVNYARLSDAYRILSKSTDQDGKPFEILRVPTPGTEFRSLDPSEPMYKNFLANLSYSSDAPPFPAGDPVYIVRSSSYANYLVTNGLIIAPRYGDDQRDSGVRVPIQGFLTRGVGVTNQGYSPHPYETFSYDQALNNAEIADFNVVPYTSVLPVGLEIISLDDAKQGPSWVHGAVLEVIMAAVGFEFSDDASSKLVCVRRHGNAFVQEVTDAVMAGGSMLGLITGVKDKSGNTVGGYAAEYVGIYSSYIGEDSASNEGNKQLNESMDHELSIRNLDPSSGNRSFTKVAYVEVSEDDKYAYTLSAIGFTQFSYAPTGS